MRRKGVARVRVCAYVPAYVPVMCVCDATPDHGTIGDYRGKEVHYERSLTYT